MLHIETQNDNTAQNSSDKFPCYLPHNRVLSPRRSEIFVENLEIFVTQLCLVPCQHSAEIFGVRTTCKFLDDAANSR